MQIEFSKRFIKAYARLAARQQQEVDQAILTYQQNRSDTALRDHALKGRLKGLRAFSAGWDLRIIYREQGGFLTIILLEVGTHNQVY